MRNGLGKFLNCWNLQGFARKKPEEARKGQEEARKRPGRGLANLEEGNGPSHVLGV